ncbi:MAG: hypothetical protein ABFD50_18725 [Smithella sp.]
MYLLAINRRLSSISTDLNFNTLMDKVLTDARARRNRAAFTGTLTKAEMVALRLHRVLIKN